MLICVMQKSRANAIVQCRMSNTECRKLEEYVDQQLRENLRQEPELQRNTMATLI